MNDDDLFPKEYISDEGTDCSEIKPEDPEQKTEEDIDNHYRISKPQRILIRAKIIHDRG